MNILNKKIPLWISCCVTVILCAICVFFCTLDKFSKQEHSDRNFANYSQEMKFSTKNSLCDEGADIYDRNFDHKNSAYYYSHDFYNMNSTDTRFILPHFKTMNQISWWACGQSSVLMVLEYFGIRQDWDEKTLSSLMEDHSKEHIGTCLDQMITMLNVSSNGKFNIFSTCDYTDLQNLTPLYFPDYHANEKCFIVVKPM